MRPQTRVILIAAVVVVLLLGYAVGITIVLLPTDGISLP